MGRIETSAKNDPWWKKLLFLTLVILALYGLMGTVGFFLWFVFPVQHIHGLTYLQIPHLILYYIILNILDVVIMILFARIIYFRRVRTSNPVKDGIILGGYTIVFSWLIDIIIYIFIRNTLPTLHEYFLGKNQPEIGIAWLTGFVAAILAGWLETQRRMIPQNRYRLSTLLSSSLLIAVSIILTIIGISFFDVKP